jgi:hypothetical protein
VTVNYHTLADFRVRHAEYLDAQLTCSVAALMAEGLVTLQRTAQDGKRLHAHAGFGSFHHRPTLERCLYEAQEQVQALRREVDADPAARVSQALKHVGELEKRQGKSHNRGARERAVRASATDPEARIMKMADGGFRPAYNAQVVTDTQSLIIVGMDVVDTPDRGQMAPHAGTSPATASNGPPRRPSWLGESEWRLLRPRRSTRSVLPQPSGSMPSSTIAAWNNCASAGCARSRPSCCGLHCFVTFCEDVRCGWRRSLGQLDPARTAGQVEERSTNQRGRFTTPPQRCVSAGQCHGRETPNNPSNLPR